MAIRLLGHVDLRVRGAATPLTPAPSLLLSMFTLAGPQPVDTGRLMSGLWGEHPPPTAEAALRVHLAALRKALGANHLVRSQAGYALTGPSMWTDVGELARLEHRSRHPDGRGAVATALGLWRGVSLANVRRLPAGGLLSVDLDRRRAQLLKRWYELALADGDGREIVGQLETDLAADPLDEHGWSLFAHALYQSQGAHAALDALSRARHELVERAGLDAGPLLRELEQRILTHDTTLSGPPRSIKVDIAPDVGSRVPVNLRLRKATPFVGREQEMGALNAVWNDVVADNVPAVAVLRGAAGIGKTAIAAEFADLVAGRGGRVLFAEASASPLSPLAPILRRHEYDPIVADQVAEISSAMAADPYAEGGRREALVHAAVELLQRVATSALLLVVDDVHLADELSAEVLSAVAKASGGARLMVLATERDEHVSSLDATAVTRINVGPLSTAAIEDWIATIGSGRLPVDIEREGHGIPLLIGLAIENRGEWDRRLHVLSARARAVTSAAAVLGRSSQMDALRDLTAIEELQLLEDVEQIQKVGLARMVSETDELAFVHDLARLAVLASMGDDRIRSTAALALRRIDSDRIGPFATLELCRRANDLVDRPTLVAVTVAVAQSLVAAFDFAAAKSETEATLERIEVPADRGPLLAMWARASLAVGDYDAADRAVHQLRGLVTESHDDVLEGQLLWIELNLGVGSDPKPAVVERLQQLVPDALERSPALGRRLQRRLLLELMNVGSIERAAEVLKTMRSDDLANSPDSEADVLPLAYLLAEASGDLAQTTALIERSNALRGEDLGPRGRTSVLEFLAARAVQFGDPDGLRDLLADLRSAATAAGEVHARWWAEALRFTPAFWAADMASAQSVADEAYAFGAKRHVHTATEIWMAQRFLVSWASGRFEELLILLERDERSEQAAWLAGRALARAVTGGLDAARRDIVMLASTLSHGGRSFLAASTAALTIEAAHHLGCVDEVDSAHAIIALHEGRRIGFSGLVDLGPADRYLALVDLAAGRTAVAHERLERIIASPRSGLIWQLRAKQDVAAVATPAGGDVPVWGWMA